MSRLSPAVAAVRNAVRAALPTATPPPPPAAGLVVVACSGGADSLALAAAAVFVAPRVGVVTVDHGLQDGSAERAQAVVKWADSAGATPNEVVTVEVGTSGGPEAAAREARYLALADAAQRLGATCVLLGHTEDDQAETVLLALARGSGPRGISAMPARFERHGVLFVRPLLGISRATCRAACEAQTLTVWDDPHNVDPSYTRARVRASVMPAIVAALGADVVPNLARTASLVAADSRYLDEEAIVAFGRCAAEAGLSVDALAALADPIRTRVLHHWVTSLGVPRAALSHRHVAAIDALVTAWHGQGATQLPGGISVHRSGRTLSYSRS
ncbi:tRNA(Ile)-lysidine synthase [Rhizocola hellebori]|uniref:tRNA(Ile)-lysidine synthase n=1 Tax=Rhizocola hellebori TaxID=1392758 RepID=A0A8J3QEP6_9ACTN|nr:tRNA lysidine(34) synthetase TilS [Rhizocola hellebori]GIH08329.1 tRNA(Ile)-lysidine synthase [Rhizocola hellebori]